MTWHDWGLPIVVLAVGLVVGLFVAIRARGGLGQDSRTRIQALLRARKEALVDKLVELEKSPEKDTKSWLAEVEPLRQAAANCLRDLEALGEPLKFGEADRATRRRAQLGWTMGSIGVLAGAIGLMMTLVLDEATERVRPVGERVAECEEILQESPKDLDCNNLLNYWQMNQLMVPHLRGVLTTDTMVDFGTQQGLWERMEKVDQIDPESSEHLLNHAILSTLFAASVDPSLIERAAMSFSALEDSELSPSVLAMWRAWYRFVQGDRALALTTLDQVVEEELNEVETRINTLLRAKLVAKVMAKVRVSDESSAVDPKQGLVYLTIRDSESGAGMPHAVKRVGGGFLGLAFEVSELDVPPMRQNAPWPDPFWIHAYYDADGVVEPGKSELDPRNVFAEPLGPFTLDDPVELQALTVSRVARSALLPLPETPELVSIEAPWLEWEFSPFGVQEGQAGGSHISRAEMAMARGDLAEAQGWLSLLQESSKGSDELWLYGALLQHLSGRTDIARARLDNALEDSERADLWLWSAWMAADAGIEAGRKQALARADELGALNSHQAFYQMVSELSPGVPLRVTVRWGPEEGEPEGMEGQVWVVVRGQVDQSGKRVTVASSTLELSDLPASVEEWQLLSSEAWPRWVWVDAYVAPGAGREAALSASPMVGPLRRGSEVELVMDPVPPSAPPGHP